MNKIETGTYKGRTAEQWRDMAQGSKRSEYDSFERCDTDGALSQWCHGLSAREYLLCADVADNGGKWEFTAIFDLDGNLQDAKYIETMYGWTWMIKNPNGGKPIFFNPSRARKGAARLSRDRAKGYVKGTIKAKAYVQSGGSHITNVYYFCSPWLEGGRMVDVEIVDGGTGGTQYQDED